MGKAKTPPKRRPPTVTDPYIVLTERYKDDSAVRRRIMSILKQREGFPDNLEAEMVGVALDELLENEKTPKGFRDLLSDYLHKAARHTGACGWRDPQELYNVKEWFTIAIEAMEEEGEPPTNTNTGATIARMLSDILEHPTMPDDANTKIREGLDLWSDATGWGDTTSRNQLAAWLPKIFGESSQQESAHTSLAEHIISIVNNPLLPSTLKEHLGEGLTQLSNEHSITTDEHEKVMRAWLPDAIAKEVSENVES